MHFNTLCVLCTHKAKANEQKKERTKTFNKETGRVSCIRDQSALITWGGPEEFRGGGGGGSLEIGLPKGGGLLT